MDVGRADGSGAPLPAPAGPCRCGGGRVCPAASSRIGGAVLPASIPAAGRHRPFEPAGPGPGGARRRRPGPNRQPGRSLWSSADVCRRTVGPGSLRTSRAGAYHRDLGPRPGGLRTAGAAGPLQIQRLAGRVGAGTGRRRGPGHAGGAANGRLDVVGVQHGQHRRPGAPVAGGGGHCRRGVPGGGVAGGAGAGARLSGPSGRAGAPCRLGRGGQGAMGGPRGPAAAGGA